MPAVILSRPSSDTDKVLRRSEYTRERNGLETLEETYTIRTSARLTLPPKNDVLHSQYSGATLKHARMAVEGVSFRDIDGDLTEMVVTYVGLTSASGLPAALVRTIPVANAGIYGPPVHVEVEFVSDSTVTQVLSGKLSSQFVASSGQLNPIPRQINGTDLPPSPRAPFSEKLNLANLSTGEIYKDLGGTLFDYYGYVQKDVQATQRGIFLVVTITYSEAMRNGVNGQFYQG